MPKNGFTLVEVLVALFVVSVGVAGAMALVIQTISFGSNASSRLTAIFLAQEGVEITRNIRDSNLLNLHNGGTVSWTNGLTACAAGCEADYKTTVLTVQDRFLNLANGFYSYDAGSLTSFKRKIFVTIAGDMITVNAQVTWNERGKTYTVSGATTLYNWLIPTP